MNLGMILDNIMRDIMMEHRAIISEYENAYGSLYYYS